jgi:uncharacterized protein with HEPN domain
LPPDAKERDAALLLDMLLTARDAIGFVAAMDEATFLGSRLHQNAVIRSLEVLGEAAGTTLKDRQPEHAFLLPRHRESMCTPQWTPPLNGAG